MNASQKPQIVVVGGGFAGIETIKGLVKKGYEVTLIDKNLVFEYYPALYRLVTGALPIEVSVPVSKIFPKGVTVIEGEYKTFDRSRRVVMLSDGREVPFDYLVVALGSETNYFNIPGLADRSYSFKSVHEALRLKQHFCEIVSEASKVSKDEAVVLLHTIVVGGGPSGVELAGDLTEYLRRVCREFGVDESYVTVDIIESNGRLLPTLTPKTSREAERRLRKLGVNIFTNRSLQSQEIEEIALKDMEMKAGTVVWTAGTRINTAYAEVPGVTLDVRKRVEVSETLNLKEDERVFIAGDGAGTMYSGLAQTAIHNGAYIARAIISRIQGKKPSVYKPHKPSFVVPIGNNWAILQHGNMVITGFIPWVLRNMIDFKYFTSIVPFSYVLAVFFKGMKYRKVRGGCPINYTPDHAE